jgi:hypothetical protein
MIGNLLAVREFLAVAQRYKVRLTPPPLDATAVLLRDI